MNVEIGGLQPISKEKLALKLCQDLIRLLVNISDLQFIPSISIGYLYVNRHRSLGRKSLRIYLIKYADETLLPSVWILYRDITDQYRHQDWNYLA